MDGSGGFEPTRGGNDRPAAIVIGSGFGGLASAVRLAGKGYRVTVLERLDAPGGRASVYRQDGFTFDAGPTIITAPQMLEDVWASAGARLSDDVAIRPCDPFYRIRFDDGQEFTYSGDREAMRAEIARFDPQDVAGYDRFLEKSGEIYRVAFEQLADKPFHSIPFTASAMADLVRLEGYKSVYGIVSRYFRHPHLRTVFSYHPLLVGGNPFTTTAYYCLIAHLEGRFGVHYAVGGTGELVRGMVRVLENVGGTMRCGAEVSQITTEDGRVTGVELASGERLEADIVVSNADPAWTYGRLLGHLPRKRWTDRKIQKSDYSMGLFVWYFGTKRRFEDVGHHTILMGPRYRGLLDDIFQNHSLSEDCSLYLHRPTASDPSLAPEGCDSFYVLSPIPNLASGDDWSAIGEAYRAKVQERLERTVMPGLGAEIMTSSFVTPADFESRYLSHLGAGFSL
ncbi:MAG: phytoene desaturase family protein, partial [Pararhodobacter sp.]